MIELLALVVLLLVVLRLEEVRAGTVRKALHTYGEHLRTCAFWDYMRQDECNCGFREAQTL